ncbi:kinesin-like protein kif11 [Anaeramoeba flamelloides]|uniref:Kinesin-like protein kif11 n=1 Tax=Anaeramoeba flamelloides TaxID=1746091 RepID=A0ABQ8ZBX6_9EUKA|nr:kinesin-like protein kif11 [Anaeramoeba flamelloides]
MTELYQDINKTEKIVPIKVVVRVRPQNKKEKENDEQICIQSKSNTLRALDKRENIRRFTFDQIFDEETTQEEVFECIMEPMLKDVLNGFNATVFAYGQTGSGKTYTMEGSTGKKSENKQKVPWFKKKTAGLIPRSVAFLLQELKTEGIDFQIKSSLVELYNEEINDLISFSQKKGKGKGKGKEKETKNQQTKQTNHNLLKIYDDKANGGIIINGLKEIEINNLKDIEDILFEAISYRKTAKTEMNKNSSRSHTIFTFNIRTKTVSKNGIEVVKCGKLNFVDLAGSENIKKSGAKNQQQKEAGKINQSLLTLGRVIHNLVQKQKYIPYRDSKLTRILQDSLGGKTKTCIITNISPSSGNIEETLSSLDYAKNAKKIKNKPIVNQKVTKNTLIVKLKNENEQLKEELILLRKKNGISEIHEHMEKEKKKYKESEQEFRNFLQQQKNENVKLKEEINKAKEKKEQLASQLKKMAKNEKLTLDMVKSLVEKNNLLHDQNDQLFTKIEKQKTLFQLNKKNLKQFKVKISGQLEKINENISTHQGTQIKNFNKIEEHLDSFIDLNNKELSSISKSVNQLNTLSESYQTLFQDVSQDKLSINLDKLSKNFKGSFLVINEQIEEKCTLIQRQLNQIIQKQSNLKSTFENILKETIENNIQLIDNYNKNQNLNFEKLDFHFKAFETHSNKKENQTKTLLDDYKQNIEEENAKLQNKLVEQIKNIVNNLFEENQTQFETETTRISKKFNRNEKKLKTFTTNIKKFQKKNKNNLQKLLQDCKINQRSLDKNLKKIENNLQDCINESTVTSKKVFTNFTNEISQNLKDHNQNLVTLSNQENDKLEHLSKSHNKKTSELITNSQDIVQLSQSSQLQLQTHLESIDKDITNSDNLVKEQKESSKLHSSELISSINQLGNDLASQLQLKIYHPSGNTPQKNTVEKSDFDKIMKNLKLTKHKPRSFFLETSDSNENDDSSSDSIDHENQPTEKIEIKTPEIELKQNSKYLQLTNKKKTSQTTKRKLKQFQSEKKKKKATSYKSKLASKISNKENVLQNRTLKKKKNLTSRNTSKKLTKTKSRIKNKNNLLKQKNN